MVLVFSLPFCLLLPDGDYSVKLKDEIVNLNLTKIIPKVFDERLPYRGFMKGELDGVSKLGIMFRSESRLVNVEDLPKIKEVGTVIKYFDKQGKEIVYTMIPNDVNLQERDMIIEGFKKIAKKEGDIPADYIDHYSQMEHYMGRQIIINGEAKRDRLGRFRYTKVKFTSNKKIHYEEQFKAALTAVNILIDLYRQETGEYWITNVTEDEIFYFKNVNDLATSMSSTIKGFTQIKPDYNNEVVAEIRDQLINPSEMKLPYFMLILDAKKSLDEEKYYLSVIYGIIALEFLVKTFIYVYCYKKGINPQVEKKLSSLHLHTLITSIIRIFISPDKLSDKLVPDLESRINLRNKIIHKSKLNVTKEEALNTITNVEEMALVIEGELDSLSNKNVM